MTPRNRKPKPASDAVIGAETLCRGGNPYINGRRVVILAVWKGALLPGFDQDAEGVYIRDDATLRAAGGLQAGDEAEVETCERGQRRVSAGTVDVACLDLFHTPYQQDLLVKIPKEGN